MVSSTPIVSDNSFRAKVEHVSYLGSEIQYECRLQDWLLTVSTRGEGSMRNVEKGQEVYIGWKKESLKLLRIDQEEFLKTEGGEK